jgi:hypothetical protein
MHLFYNMWYFTNKSQDSHYNGKVEARANTEALIRYDSSKDFVSCDKSLPWNPTGKKYRKIDEGFAIFADEKTKSITFPEVQRRMYSTVHAYLNDSACINS